mgnify:CR=1 FL=1
MLLNISSESLSNVHRGNAICFQPTLSVNKLWHFLYHWVGQKSRQKSQFTLAIITKPYNCRRWYFLWFNYLWCTTWIPSLRAFWGGSEFFWYIWHGITHVQCIMCPFQVWNKLLVLNNNCYISILFFIVWHC